jgi:hypothetical protein
MPERDHAAEKASPHPRAPAAAAARTALPSAIGNRAMSRAMARMEAGEAVDALSESLAAGVLGAQQRVVDTMAAFSHDTGGFDQVSTDYEEKAKTPLGPSLAQVPAAAAEVPDGWYPGIAR